MEPDDGAIEGIVWGSENPPISPISSATASAGLVSSPSESSASNIGFRLLGAGLLPSVGLLVRLSP